MIKVIGDEAKKIPSMSNVVLMLDAMAIQKGTWWDPKQKCYVGHVDYGTGTPEADDDLATEALVFMISGVTGHWKHPMAYFLQNKISVLVQAQLIKDCIGLLSSNGLNAVALVFDGSFANQSSVVHLGCKMKDPQVIQTWFPHPDNASKRIYAVFDVCHMIKLMRNLLGDKKVHCQEIDRKSHKIPWSYIEALNNLQEGLGFSLANKLKKQHIVWQKQKMNVGLAAQTLSLSVASVIDFLWNEISLKQFEGSETTTDFIRKVGMAFDILNSCNPYAKNYKAPINLKNLSTWTANCESLALYFLGLKDPTGSFLLENCHKTVVWGLVFSLKSLAALFTELLQKDENTVKYVLTYKFLQDHPELLFNKIRHFGGWNNNPKCPSVQVCPKMVADKEQY